MRSPTKFLGRWVVPAVAALLIAGDANAELLSEITFAGGTIGETLADNPSINGTGMVDDFGAFTNPAEFSYVTGLSGSLGSFDNALQTSGMSTRLRAIIDRTTPAWQNSGLIETTSGFELIGADNTTLYGSVLIENSNATASGFTGLEFAIGNPNANRKITIGEADTATGLDYVVLGPGQAGQDSANDLDLPAITANETREIVFRIDYGEDFEAQTAVDTFTLINDDGTDGASGMGDFTFSTLHLASFTGAPSITYDDIRLGTTLADVRFVEGGVGTLGDFDNDGDVDLDDLDQYNGNLGAAPTGALADLDLDQDGDIDADDLEQHYGELVETSNGETGTFAGDLNLDGTVNVLGDAFPLIGNLGNSATSWAQGDFNADGTTNVLGDAFALVGNLGNSNASTTGPATSAVPEPGSGTLVALVGLILTARRRR